MHSSLCCAKALCAEKIAGVHMVIEKASRIQNNLGNADKFFLNRKQKNPFLAGGSSPSLSVTYMPAGAGMSIKSGQLGLI